ncbi:MAG: peptidylprolyl isomerase [Thermoprotei archaeon]|nr:MAG: peptidylprolyl isomerase [Thermoprotei archaeon]
MIRLPLKGARVLKVPIQKGDYVLIDYVAKVKETGEIIDLTKEDVAKEARFYREDGIYEPQLVIVGEGWVLEGLDEALTQMEVGEEKTVEIPPEKAFGERDPSKVRTVPARELARRGITPRLGARIEFDGRLGLVRSIGGGRVILDFNHPLAGHSIVYEVKVVSKIEGNEDKVLELLHRRFRRIPKDRFKIKLEENVLDIEVPEEAFTLEDLQYAKRGLVIDIQRYMPQIQAVRFHETYTIKKSEAPASQEP